MNDNDIDDELVEHIIENGEEFYSLDWDSCGPGAGAGCEYVYCWKGQYAVMSADNGNSGPYAKLEDALTAHDLLMVTSATIGVWCSVWTARQLANRLHCEVDDGHELSLNGEDYVYRGAKGKFLRKPKPKTKAQPKKPANKWKRQ